MTEGQINKCSKHYINLKPSDSNSKNNVLNWSFSPQKLRLWLCFFSGCEISCRGGLTRILTIISCYDIYLWLALSQSVHSSSLLPPLTVPCFPLNEVISGNVLLNVYVCVCVHVGVWKCLCLCYHPNIVATATGDALRHPGGPTVTLAQCGN